MANEIYRDRLINNIRRAVGEARAAASVDHAPMRGGIREIAASEIIDPFLTSDFKIGTGKICDSHGNQSAQTDLIIYAPSILPAVMHNESLGVFPGESCLYAIEIKSRLDAGELKKTISNASRMRKLHYGTESGHLPDGRPLMNKTILSLFAFDSDLTTGLEGEVARYARHDPEWDSVPLLRAICIVGVGYLYFDMDNRRWMGKEPSTDFDEVIDFVSGIGNTLSKLNIARRRVDLGKYLMMHRVSHFYQRRPLQG